MTPAAERLHRLLLLLLAVLLLAGGVLVLLTGLGTFGSRLGHRAVFDNLISRYVGDHGSWLWPVLAVLALVLGYLAVRWLLTLFSVAGVSRVDLTARGAAGRTVIDSTAVTAAVTTQIQRYRDVTGASAQVQGQAKDPHLTVTVTATADADLTALRQRIETEALADLRQALQRPDLAVQLDVKLSNKTSGRTR